MKVILSLILMFLSAQSFADLKGKTLLCESIDNKGSLFGYYFHENYKFQSIYVRFENDKYSIFYSLFEDYTLVADEVILSNRGHIDRKSLIVVGPSGTNVAQCELSGWVELYDRIEEYKNEQQEEYNKKLEGNKI